MYHCGPVGSIRRAATTLEPLLAASVVWVLAWTAARGFSSLAVFRGPLGWVLVAMGGAVALGRGVRSRSWAPRNVTLFAVAAVFNLSLGLHYASGLRVSGDEPHYLLMAQSLWREGDLDLRDNLARQDFREYTPGPIAPHWGAPRKDGRPFPAHSPGLPVLLAPFYALWGRLGCVFVLGLLAAWLAVEVRLLGRSLLGTGPDLTAWIIALGPPVVFFAFHVYTEVPSTLALTLALRLLLGTPGPALAVAAALSASALPWLHLKMIPAAAVLGLVALVRLRGRPRTLFFAVGGVAAGGFLVYYSSVFGTPWPTAIYGGLPADLTLRAPARALVGLLLDRSFGLLPHAPIFLLALAGLPALCRVKHWPLLLLALALLAPILTWRMWWGGQCPPGRFLVPLVPFLALAAAAGMTAPRRGLHRWRVPLAAAGLALAVFMALRPGELLLVNRGDRPTRVWAALSGEAPVGRYLPSLVSSDPAETRTATVWLGVLVGLLALHAGARRSGRVDSLFTGLTLPLALLLAALTLIDLWAKPFDGSTQQSAISHQQRQTKPLDVQSADDADQHSAFSYGNDRRVGK